PNSRSRPELLQVLGDFNIGAKVFTPREVDQPWSFGGEAELWLFNGTGGVGLDGRGTSFALRALGTLDLDNRKNPDDRVPVRVHANLGYLFDNTGLLVEELETREPPAGRGERITRAERFGLGINRVDFFGIGIGAEYLFPAVRPFVEWSIDVPVNRQSYVCNVEQATDHGDACLGDESKFPVAPSRLTVGARAFPWEGRGLALLGAFEIGTGATSLFVDEVAPELPWSIWLGLAYAVDTQPPRPRVVVERVEAPKPAGYTVTGQVVERGSLTGIPNAILRYTGVRRTGMVADETGHFTTEPLEPGTYTLTVSAERYKTGECTLTVPPKGSAPSAAAPASPAAPATPEAPSPLVPLPDVPGMAPPAPAAESAKPAAGATVQCELEKEPRVGTLLVQLVDSETYAPVAGARVRITDHLGRELVLDGDASGAFRFENVAPGPVKLTIDAPGYLPNVTEITVQEYDELKSRIPLNARPAKPNVQLQGKEIRLRRPITFQAGSGQLTPESRALVEELADYLRNHPEVGNIEVQGHTDDAGSTVTNQTLSQNRAQAVADALVRLGVDAGRVRAKGYGDTKPLVPNTTDENRARNNRVQIVIQN
ncbi:MAG: OmpA family protein, partial [Pseudomonadota bacterium]